MLRGISILAKLFNTARHTYISSTFFRPGDCVSKADELVVILILLALVSLTEIAMSEVEFSDQDKWAPVFESNASYKDWNVYQKSIPSLEIVPPTEIKNISLGNSFFDWKTDRVSDHVDISFRINGIIQASCKSTNWTRVYFCKSKAEDKLELTFWIRETGRNVSLWVAFPPQNYTPSANKKVNTSGPEVIPIPEVPRGIIKDNNTITSSKTSPISGQLPSNATEVIVMPISCIDNNYDKFSTIQRAINRVSPGGIVRVTNGEYPETVVINKTIKLIGVDKNNTIIKATDKNLVGVSIQANEVNISGFTIEGWDIGIKLNSASISNISNNIIRDNIYGILVSNCYNSQIQIDKNIFDSNIEENIRLYSSSGVSIDSNNILDGKKLGVFLYETHNSKIINNKIAANDDDVYLKNSWLNNISKNEYNINNLDACKIFLEDSERNEIDAKCTRSACLNSGKNCSCCN